MALRYFELIDHRYSIPAQDLRAIRGVICAKCHGGPVTLEFRGKREPGRWHFVEVCATCRSPWSRDESGEFDVPRVGRFGGGVQLGTQGAVDRRPGHSGRLRVEPKVAINAKPTQPGSDAAEARIIDNVDELAELRAVMDNRPPSWTKDRWTFTAQAWRVYLHPRIGSFQAAAEYGSEYSPRFEARARPSSITA